MPIPDPNEAPPRLPDEAPRLGRYAADEAFEALLRRGNDHLAPLEEELVRHAPRPAAPFVVLCGAPRSGTTLLAQLLARSRAFDYVSNFTARFWKAPYFASLLEQRIGLKQALFPNRIESEYGVTPQPNEPHEFGFFWNSWLRYEGDTHRIALRDMEPNRIDGLRSELWRLSSLSSLPFLIKNNIVGLNAAAAMRVLGDVRFVVVRRDPLFTAQSIYLAREEMLGSADPFWSLRPSGYAAMRSLDAPEQIAHQLAGIYEDIRCDLAEIGAPHVEIGYESLCRDPVAAVETVGRLAETPIDRAQLEHVRLSSRNTNRLDAAVLSRLSGALRDAGMLRGAGALRDAGMLRGAGALRSAETPHGMETPPGVDPTHGMGAQHGADTTHGMGAPHDAGTQFINEAAATNGKHGSHP